MSNKYNDLEELRRKKEMLQNEIDDMEHLLKFENKKESLSALTHGFTDQFVEQKIDENGEDHLTVKTGEIAKKVGEAVTRKTEEKSIINFNNAGLSENALETAIRLAGVLLAGNIAKNNLRKKSWKNRLFGLAMVYLLPTAIKFASEKLEEYQRKKSISSLEKLI